MRHTREEYNVRPNVTTVREVLNHARDDATCVMKVDDGPKLRLRQGLSEVRRRVAAGKSPSLRLSLRAVRGKGRRGGNKVEFRLKPKTSANLKTYSKKYQKKKLKPMDLPTEAGQETLLSKPMSFPTFGPHAKMSQK